MCIFHKWEKWETVAKGQLSSRVDALNQPKVIGVFEIQRRVCAVCGQSELREATS